MNKVVWVGVRLFESGVIKGSKMLLVSKCYPTRDLDLLVSLGILPDSIDCFGRKASLSAVLNSQLVRMYGSHMGDS